MQHIDQHTVQYLLGRNGREPGAFGRVRPSSRPNPGAFGRSSNGRDTAVLSSKFWAQGHRGWSARTAVDIAEIQDFTGPSPPRANAQDPSRVLDTTAALRPVSREQTPLCYERLATVQKLAILS